MTPEQQAAASVERLRIQQDAHRAIIRGELEA
jgi:hypothetical protein